MKSTKSKGPWLRFPRPMNPDAAAVLALEGPAIALLKAIEAALPAIERLNKSNYPGADWVDEQVGGTTSDEEYSLASAVQALEMFRGAGGNLAAFDHAFYVELTGLTVRKAADVMVEGLGTDLEALARVKAMQEYAAWRKAQARILAAGPTAVLS